MRTLAGARDAPEALLLTGPLGAGKTTLLRRTILPALAGRRVVVLVNDAGEVPLDALLLAETEVPAIGVAGGCFCCHAGGRLLEALAEIRDRLAPEILILEGSGLSPPEPLLAGLVGEGYVPLGALAVVAPAQLARLDRDPLLRAQLAAAGAIVLSGADRLDRAGFETARRALAALGDRPLFPAFEGVVRSGIAALLGPGTAEVSPGDGRLHHHVATLSLELAGLPPRRSLRAWLEAAPASVLRVKGIVQTAEHAAPLAVSWALGEVDLRPVESRARPGLWIVHEGAEPRTWLDAAPVGVDPADWATLAGCLEPSGERDGRPDAAFLDGRRVSPLEAAEALLDRLAAASRPLLLTSAAALTETAGRWSPAATEVVAIADARVPTIDAAAERAEADLLLLAGLPDAIAERIAGRRRDLPVLHLARRWAIPDAAVSLRVTAEQETVLARACGSR